MDKSRNFTPWSIAQNKQTTAAAFTATLVTLRKIINERRKMQTLCIVWFCLHKIWKQTKLTYEGGVSGFCFGLVLVALGLEFRALHFLGMYSTTWNAFLQFWIFVCMFVLAVLERDLKERDFWGRCSTTWAMPLLTQHFAYVHAGDGAQGLTHAREALHHWAPSPALLWHLSQVVL
jgi:hypothetical protein